MVTVGQEEEEEGGGGREREGERKRRWVEVRVWRSGSEIGSGA